MSEPRRKREPVFNVPTVILITIVVLVAIHALRTVLSEELDARLVTNLAFVPGRLTFLLRPQGVIDRIATWASGDGGQQSQQVDFARYFLGRPTPALVTLVTYGFLHGGWTHLLFNGVSLVAFGAPVARRLRWLRFLVLLLVGSIAGGIAHWLCFPYGFMPVIGASAGVSAAMGAAARFAFEPPSYAMDEVGHLHPVWLPTKPLIAMVRDRRVMGFIVAWFIGNTIFGVTGAGSGLSDMPVAWQAHIGGFVVGLMAFRWFDPPHPTMEIPLPPVDTGALPAEPAPPPST